LEKCREPLEAVTEGYLECWEEIAER